MTKGLSNRWSFLVVCFFIVFITSSASAADIKLDTLKTKAGELAQKKFDALSRDMGRAIHLNPGNSPEPNGILGFSVGAEVSLVKVDEMPIKLASGQGVNGSIIPTPKLRAQKGLPWGFDIGIVYLPTLTEINVGMYGGELRMDLLELLPITPPILHLSARATYTKLTGISNLELQTIGYDLSAGLNFPIIKPYAGAGGFEIESKPIGDAESLFSKSTKTEIGYFGGIKLTFIPLIPINLEYEKNSNETYSIKIGAEF